MTFNNIILVILFILIIFAIYIYYKAGIGSSHTFKSKSVRDWMKNNGIKVDFYNKKLIRKSDGKTINIEKRGNSNKCIELCRLKNITSKKLIENGIPAPPFYVCDNNLSIEENLNKIYLKLKPPFVVKPTNGVKGDRVTVNINTYKELKNKVSDLMKNPYRNVMAGNTLSKCMVEEYTEGKDYRILIHKKEIIDIVEKTRASVVGDGVLTLKELITEYNKKRKKYNKIKNLDEKFLMKQGYKMDMTVPYGNKVDISGVINLSNGANANKVDINQVHPENIEIFKKCSEVLEGTNLGIDYVSPSISLSYMTGGVIIEVNSSPGFGPHREAHNNKDEVYDMYFQTIFKD